MAGAEWSLQDAKNSLSAVVDAASKGTPQTITKRGKRTAVVLSAAEYDRLQKRQATLDRSFLDHLLAMPKDDEEFDRTQIEPRDVEF